MKLHCWVASSLVTLVTLVAAYAPAIAQNAKPAPSPAAQPLWPDGAPGAKGKIPADIPTLTVYLPPPDKVTGAAVVICPGGGYGFVAMDHEGHQVARWLNSLGVAGIILNYRHAPAYHHPAPLQDAQRALRTTRARAREWGIDLHRIGILGFSAGGHLASTTGTHFDRGQPDAADPIERQSSRPDFMVLIYPVISLTSPATHKGSRTNLLGKNPDPKLVESLSNEKQVTDQTPPTFLVHTSEDIAVPPENSIAFYRALHKHHVPAELHIFEKGAHGLGLGRAGMAFARWPDLCTAWLETRKIIGKKERGGTP
jgi:acetyl esterase/lipase